MDCQEEKSLPPGIVSILQPKIADIGLKCCILRENSKNSISGRSLPPTLDFLSGQILAFKQKRGGLLTSPFFPKQSKFC